MSEADRSGPGALAGLRVLDLSSLYAAPYIATLLADHGADVVKVEPPGGDEYRHFPNRMWPLLARGKRVVELDLRGSGAEVVRSLIPDIDAVIVNMPQELLERIGLDWETLSAINPGLVYAHVSGYGLDGPYAGRPGNGTLGEAFAGLTHMTGEPDGPPVIPSLPLGDAVTGLVGAFGVLAACYRRLAVGGPGQVVDVNPAEALLSVVGPVLTAYDPASGETPVRRGSRLPGSPLRNVFRTRDGRWVAISSSTPRHVAELVALSGHPQDAAGDLEDSVRAWVATLDRATVLDTLVAHRVPNARVSDARDLTTDPHLAARGSLLTVSTPEFGDIVTPAPAPRLLGTPARRPDRTPRVGEHNADLHNADLLGG